MTSVLHFVQKNHKKNLPISKKNTTFAPQRLKWFFLHIIVTL
jgi:hypothetical protein